MVGIAHERRPAKCWRDLTQECKALSGNIGRLERQAREIAAGPRETRDKTATDRVRYRRKDDWDNRCRLLDHGESGGPRQNDDIDLKPDELCGDLAEALTAGFCPAILDGDG